MTVILSRPSLYGELLGRPVRAFMTGLMFLAGLILLASCAHLGILFSARAADRSREVALRLALGSSRSRILRQLFTEAVLISVTGGTVGLLGSLILLHGLGRWQPFARFPIHVPVNPDANTYGVALLLALVSGFFFGAVPVRQILRTNPYEVIKSGAVGRVGRWISVRELLLVAQVAICALLVTSSMVAVRGLMRSVHSDFGFEPENALLADTDLSMAGYSRDRMPAMQKRMIEAAKTIPGVTSVGLADGLPLAGRGTKGFPVFTDQTTDLRPSNAAARAITYSISPEYFAAAGTTLLAGRALSWHDDKDSPRVAVVNREFANRIFGSVTKALSGYYKMQEGTRVRVVGIVKDGKYANLTEAPEATMFVPILQSPSSETWLVVRSNREPNQLVATLKSTLQNLDSGLPFFIQPWSKELDNSLFPARMATLTLGVLGVMGAMLSITGIFGMASYAVSTRLRELGIRVAIGAGRKEVLRQALGRALKLLTLGSAAGLLLGILASRVLAFIVYEANSRDPVVLGGVVLAMSMLGLLATWVPAQRALSVDPLILLREQ
jgi:predicted permease